MKKSIKNRRKDAERIRGKVWIDEPITAENRKCGSGVTFGGRYVNKVGNS